MVAGGHRIIAEDASKLNYCLLVPQLMGILL